MRFTPPEQTLLVHLGNIIGVLSDISVGGVSFYSSVLMSTEREFNLLFDLKFKGRLKVINCTLDEAMSTLTKPVYRVGTRFIESEDGYRCTVQSLRLISRVTKI